MIENEQVEMNIEEYKRLSKTMSPTDFHNIYIISLIDLYKPTNQKTNYDIIKKIFIIYKKEHQKNINKLYHIGMPANYYNEITKSLSQSYWNQIKEKLNDKKNRI